MGRQIVYCEGCGHNLREDDFEKSRARMIDNRPFCIECRPFRPGEAEPARRSSSGKIPAGGGQPRKNPTGAIPVIAPPRRASPGGGGSNPVPVIAGVGGLLFIALLFALAQGGSRRTPVPETMPPLPVEAPIARRLEPLPPSPPPPPPPPTLPPASRGTPSPPAPPTGPLVAPTASEKLDAFLAQIRGMIQSDERQERTEEILNMFSAAAKVAGPRSAEVAKMKADYAGTLNETARRLVVWSDWRITSNAEAGMTALYPTFGGRDSVYLTHPLDRTTPATLERDLDVPSGKKTTFSFWVACHQMGDFELRVYVDRKQVMKELIGPPGSGWRQKSIDLTPYAGKKIALRLEDFPNDWNFEHAYWSDLVVSSE
ncbi:MAG TPA: hypothetical protein VMU54_03575 [Planctomycetota bacterium]|nr:hypothetical protein [Planctomycetota bacterium]